VRTALRALCDGPNVAESAAAVKTAVPAGTRLVSFSVSGGVANVNMILKVLNSTGHRIARRSVLASCGTGCRGHFAVTISARSGHPAASHRAHPGHAVAAAPR
jgi:hypothetical protein